MLWSSSLLLSVAWLWLPDVSKERRLHPQRVVFEPENEKSEINNLVLQGTESLTFIEVLRMIAIFRDTENT